MKKLTLDLDDLRVSTFDTAEARDARGTVAGYDVTQNCPPTGPEEECPHSWYHTCEIYC